MYPYVGAAQAAPEAPPPRVLTDRGWVTLFPMGVYSNKRSGFEALPVEALTEALIWAEKQWTLDRVDTRNGYVKVTVPAGTTKGAKKSGSIEVPSDDLWYLCCHEIAIPKVAGLTAGDICVNFRVSSFPKSDDVEKLYYDENDPKVYLTTGGAKVSGGGLCATQAEIAAGDIYDHKLIVTHGWIYTTEVTAKDWAQELMRDFRECDELNTELRLAGGAKLTLEATVATADTAGADVDVYLRVWGRVAKRLVE
jgi:hypothetical protein